MKQRISYLIKLFLAFLLFFVLQKIVFVYLNEPLPAGDLFQVIVHGLGLDASTTGYLLIFPFLVVWLSIWMRHMKTKAVLRPYFILIAILLSLILWQTHHSTHSGNSSSTPRSSITWTLPNRLWPVSPPAMSSCACFGLRYSPFSCHGLASALRPNHSQFCLLTRKMLLHNFTYVLLGGLIFFGHTRRDRTFHHEYRQRLFQ